MLVRAAVGDDHAGLDLVEDEHGAVGGGEVADALQEAGQRRHHADVELDRLDEDGGDLALVVLQDLLQASALLYGATTVSCRREAGRPAEAGTVQGDSGGPISSRGGWMEINTSSWWPW